MPLPKEITIGEKYAPAMNVANKIEAQAYFEDLVQHSIQYCGKTREEAEELERTNLGYFAGYYDHETRERVERFFKCEHPVFGSIKKNGPPTFNQAFVAGLNSAGLLEADPDRYGDLIEKVKEMNA